MSKKRNDRKDKRRAEALERQAARAERGDKGQIEKLCSEGHGHTKEVKRLWAKRDEFQDLQKQ